MDLFEYQGRDLFERHGLPVLGGGVAETPQEARAIAERLGGKVVVKAQVKVGGRGKAGGVKLADGADEAEARATDILGMDIKGHTVHKVMLAETADIKEEYYFSYLLDRANRTFLCIASVAGGMEIETVAEEDPERVAKIAIDASKGVDEAITSEPSEEQRSDPLTRTERVRPVIAGECEWPAPEGAGNQGGTAGRKPVPGSRRSPWTVESRQEPSSERRIEQPLSDRRVATRSSVDRTRGARPLGA